MKPTPTSLEKAAVLVLPHLLVDQAAPVAVPPLEALLPLPLDLVEVGLDKSVQGGSHEDSWPDTGPHRLVPQ